MFKYSTHWFSSAIFALAILDPLPCNSRFLLPVLLDVNVEICTFLLEQFSNQTVGSFETVIVVVEDFEVEDFEADVKVELNFCADEVEEFDVI